MMSSRMKGDYSLDAEAYDLRHVLRKAGDRLGYVYDLGDSWRHIITVLDVIDKGNTLSMETINDIQIKETCPSKEWSTRLFLAIVCWPEK